MDSVPDKQFAEREGFEPSVHFKGVRRFSKPFLSATQAPLRFFLEQQRYFKILYQITSGLEI
jgi:hypothetical protein